MIGNKILNRIKGDKVIWMVVIFLSLVSLLLVYSSTGALAYKRQGGNTEYYFIRHFIILVLGLVIMFGAHLIKYTIYARFANFLVIISIPILGYTLFKGAEINEANRWLVIPIVNLSFQSSDLGKLALIIFLARFLTVRQDTIKDFKKGFLPVIIFIGLICGLILPANFSTAAFLFFTCVILLYIGRVSMKHLFQMLGLAITILSVFLVILLNSSEQGRFGTWKKRIENFRSNDPEVNYQSNQSKIAIASSYPIGKGPGNSTQRNFLPHPYSDFIFAIIIEEYGLIGGFLVLLAYLILLFRAVRIATKSPGTFGAFLSLGLTLLIVFQALINMAVAVNLLPVTGQPLPLVSMGGTSLWFTSIAFGIILSVSKEIDKEQLSEIGIDRNENYKENE